VAGNLRFAVTKAKVNWAMFFQDMIRGGTAGNSCFDNYSGRGPSEGAQNALGDKRVLVLTKNLKDARGRAATIERDFTTLSTENWCERYNVPVSFVAG
jgi:hypothetical protein